MPKDEQKPMTRAELLAIIEQARRENWEELDLRRKGITELPPEIGQLKRIPTYTGDYLWLCEKHYELSQSKIPDKIE
jgi:Leucine-rich repeat (LRR) protein